MTIAKILSLGVLIFLSRLCFAEPTFRLHINSEPATLSPFVQKSSSGSYLFTQLHSPLLWVLDGQIQDNLGHCVQNNSKQISCSIFKWAKFSNGTKITAESFVQIFQEFLNPKNPAYRADLLLEIKNAKSVLNGKLPAEKLGVHSKRNKLIIELENANYEFIYNLANPILSPVFDVQKKNGPYDETWVVSGPYKLKSWEPKQKIILTSNPHFPGARPDLEFSFITEDTVAMNLYEKNELDFLRRVPTLYIPKYQERADFHAIDQFRFDFIALSSKVPLEIRKNLISSPDFAELQKLLLAKPRPGCVGIPVKLLKENVCIKQTSKQISSTTKTAESALIYVHSKLGGDDQTRIAQWFQSEWEQKAHLKIGISELENRVFLDELNKRNALIFHKGIAPDRTTCGAVLENFLANAPENYLDISNTKLNSFVNALRESNSLNRSKSLCSKALAELLKSNNFIPLGPIYFSILVKNNWKNWTLNELNQLNLSHLKWEK